MTPPNKPIETGDALTALYLLWVEKQKGAGRDIKAMSVEEKCREFAEWRETLPGVARAMKNKEKAARRRMRTE